MITNRSLAFFTCTLAYLIVASCAAPISDSPGLSQFSDYTYITTSPEQLRCEYQGRNATKITETTPHFVNMNPLSAPIKIVCSKSGYWDSNLVIEPIRFADLFDRLQNKKIITLANAGHSKTDIGPVHLLPRKVHIVLRRNFFQNIKTRDSYYAEEHAFAQERWNHLLSKIKDLCKNKDQLAENPRPYITHKSCSKARKTIKHSLRNDLMAIELQRRKSLIK